MVFNYSILRGKIRELYNTQEAFAEAMGMSTATISAKLNNKVLFNQREIDKAVEVLGIETSDIPRYFFTPMVQETEHVE